MAYQFQLPSMKPRKPPRRPLPPKPLAPPAAPKPAPLPVDPAYDQQVAGLMRSRDDTLAALGGQQASTLTNYGYGASFNPGGGVASLSFDPSNPFSQAALLRKKYQQAKSASGNSMAARGQLYAGAYQQAQDALGVEQLQGEDSLQRQLIQALSGIETGRRQASTDYELGAGAALADRLGRAPENPTYEPVAPAPKPKPAKPSAAVVARVKKRWLAEGRRK